MRLVVLFCFSSVIAFGQTIATYKVSVPVSGTDVVPVSVNLDPKIDLADSLLFALYEKSSPVPFQLGKNGEARTLSWIVKAGETSTYTLRKAKHKATAPRVTATAKDGEMIIRSGDKNLLSYVYKTVYPPAGVDSAYRRSGFIHPLWSPSGKVLTRTQPKDHYHHYGIWNPWTHTLYKGDTIDFWNIGNGKATVRFSKFMSQTSGDIFAEYVSVHEHVVTKKGTKPDVAMEETQVVRVYNPGPDYYIMDFTSYLQCASDAPITLLEYRYGGFGWRTTEKWDNKNSEVITSEGKNRKEADGSLARWCIIQGAIDDAYAGAVMMSHPENYNHPEPLRIWPENQYNRGDMFANFSPTKNKDWALEPGKTYVLRYRMLVFDNKMTKERAEAAWEAFAQPPTVVGAVSSKK
ncbi:MAG TPA: PmoA family protein [Cyclobacteriaceae bacterium]|nr:PmoA family protein [Cyclobacteriaceae bacterium]